MTQVDQSAQGNSHEDDRVLLTSLTLISCLFVSAQEAKQVKSEFLKPTIDIGCVVSDIDAAVKFYTNLPSELRPNFPKDTDGWTLQPISVAFD